MLFGSAKPLDKDAREPKAVRLDRRERRATLAAGIARGVAALRKRAGGLLAEIEQSREIQVEAACR